MWVGLVDIVDCAVALDLYDRHRCFWSFIVAVVMHIGERRVPLCVNAHSF